MLACVLPVLGCVTVPEGVHETVNGDRAVELVLAQAPLDELGLGMLGVFPVTLGFDPAPLKARVVVAEPDDVSAAKVTAWVPAGSFEGSTVKMNPMGAEPERPGVPQTDRSWAELGCAAPMIWPDVPVPL